MNEFRKAHNKKIGRLFVYMFLLHLFLMPIVAFIYKTEVSVAILVGMLITGSSFFAYKKLSETTLLIDLNAANAMFQSALVMYAMRGIPEAHFHFFIMMSFLIAFAAPRAIIVATVTISVHHIGAYFFLPGVGFAADYPFALYALHFVAAVLQAVPSIGIGHYASKIIDNQGEVIGDLQNHATDTKGRSHSLLDLSQKLSETVLGQAQAVDETVSTLDELSAMMETNLKNIGDSNERVTESHHKIEVSRVTLSEMATAMNDINDNNNELLKGVGKVTEKFEEIEDAMRKIYLKTQVINNITLQTKLLSINASVEAARAGEHGTGFSVVAEEVGHLAQTSKTAADEINELLDTSSRQIEKALSDIKTLLESHLEVSRDKVNTGNQLVDKSVDALDIVYQNVDNLKETFQHINIASNEQMTGFSNIHGAIRLFQDHIRSLQDMILSNNNLSNELRDQSDKVLASVSTLAESVVNESKRKHDSEKMDEKPSEDGQGDSETAENLKKVA